MKTIEPLSLWVNGNIETATKLNVAIVRDDLESTATFVYRLCKMVVPEGNTEPIPTQLENGNVTMSGQSYIDWDGSNQAAYVFVANALNLTLSA